MIKHLFVILLVLGLATAVSISTVSVARDRIIGPPVIAPQTTPGEDEGPAYDKYGSSGSQGGSTPPGGSDQTPPATGDENSAYDKYYPGNSPSDSSGTSKADTSRKTGVKKPIQGSQTNQDGASKNQGKGRTTNKKPPLKRVDPSLLPKAVTGPDEGSAYDKYYQGSDSSQETHANPGTSGSSGPATGDEGSAYDKYSSDGGSSDTPDSGNGGTAYVQKSKNSVPSLSDESAATKVPPPVSDDSTHKVVVRPKDRYIVIDVSDYYKTPTGPDEGPAYDKYGSSGSQSGSSPPGGSDQTPPATGDEGSAYDKYSEGSSTTSGPIGAPQKNSGNGFSSIGELISNLLKSLHVVSS